MYIWCREEPYPGKPHWHFTLFLNANNVRYLDITYASNLWSKILASNVTGCLDQVDLGGFKRGMIVKRGDHVSIADAIYKISYLSKYETKDNIDRSIKRFGSSQIL